MPSRLKTTLSLPLHATEELALGVEVYIFTPSATDIQNEVGLVGAIGSEEGIEAGIHLNVDKHAGEP